MRGNAVAAVDQRREEDLQAAQGWGKLSEPTQGKGQPKTCFNLVRCHCKGCVHPKQLARLSLQMSSCAMHWAGASSWCL